MNNREVRQISDEEVRQTLTKEELQQTQVLNFQEVQKAIRFEKITSKRPAVLVAIIGIISLLFGGSLQIANSLKTTPKNIQKRDTKQNIQLEIKNLNCTKKIDNQNNTNTVYNITYKFENDKLVGFTKEYTVSATSTKEESKKSIEEITTEFKSMMNEIDGYQVSIYNNEKESVTLTVTVDYKKLDLTKLNNIQQTKQYTKVDYNKNQSYIKIKEDMTNQEFTIQ